MKLPEFTFEDLISPMLDNVFQETVKGKKAMVFRGDTLKKNIFGGIITWQQFSDYINNHRAVAGLQVVKPDGTKLCMEKDNLYRDLKPNWERQHRYEKKYVHELWNSGSSIILTKASLLTPNISAVAKAVEDRYPGKAAADAHFYCSPNADARSFPCHADLDDNLLVHAIGSVRWKVYNVWAKIDTDEKGRRKFVSSVTMSEEEETKHTPIIDTVLNVGDLLYIPAGMFHKAIPIGPRISISVPFSESDTQRPLDRNYYDFTKNIS